LLAWVCLKAESFLKHLKALFVCSVNAHRSPLAEALLRKLRPDLDVDSAGIRVAIPISEEVREYLSRENADQYLKESPEDLGSKQLRDYYVIVAMEQRHKDAVSKKCPECADRIVVWNVDDPYFMSRDDAVKIYRQIEAKVTELAKSSLL
jgi:protein-tyrosine-phosphatase